MTNKILLYADLHIGAPMVDAVNPLKKIVDIAIERNVSHVISLGDDFDHEITTPKQRKTFADEIGRLLAVGIKVAVLPGNHSRKFEYDAYRLGITILDSPGWVQWEGLNLGCLPHMNYALLSDKIPSYKDFDREANQNIAALLDRMLAEETEMIEKSICNLVIGHGVIGGAKLDNGMIPKGNGVTFTQAKLAEFYSLVRFGHYHLRQNLTDRVGYIGSPSPVNFGERDTVKGVEIIEFASSFTGGYKSEFVEIKAPKIYVVKTSWEDGKFYPDPLMGKSPEDYKDSFVKIQYKVSQTNSGSVNLAFLEELSKHTLLPAQVEPIIDMQIVTRAPEFREPMTHEKAVEVYWEHKDVPADRRAKLIILRKEILEASL